MFSDNEEIIALIKKQRLFRYEIADAMGVSESYLSTLLRKPLTERHKNQILQAINKIKEREEMDND